MLNLKVGGCGGGGRAERGGGLKEVNLLNAHSGTELPYLLDTWK